MRECPRCILGHYGFGGFAASNEREGDAMNRTFKLVTLGVLGAWLLTSTSCEDKVCNDALQTCKKEATEQRKEGASNLAKLTEIKTQLAATQAKVDSLTKENDELKAKSEAAEAKVKAKGGKGKHKKKGKK
jgi:peptidoglycan hydrolase CwlO-like protein